ncbi:integrin beta-7 [Trichomycterus rosablanca]|uniref:integrin beta-7 n=1 Tax=Trichomycterus rosablanca TaxID=2290929 RepID=UPI002F3605B3
MRFVLALLVLHLLGQKCTAAQAPVCQPQPTCSNCLRSPGCAWCKQKDFLKLGESAERRCDSAESLKTRNCNRINVIDPQADTISIKDNGFNSNKNNVVQLKPQGIKVKLRVGVPHKFNVEFKRAEGYPIDLYYLMDLSYSMKDDLEKIKNLGEEILKKLQEDSQTVRIGFGSFVDKEKLPYVSQVRSRRQNPCPTRFDTCQPAFTFRNVLPLTDKANEFKRKVSTQKISGNLDSPEAGLDAIMQAAVCQEEIKWQNVTRILVYTSDDTFHMAGDGRLAGIFKPHDGHCHLKSDGFYDGNAFDYPSVGQLSRALQANNIQLIFAVTEKIFPSYQALSTFIPQSVVGVLKDDSSNVVQLISEAYRNLSSTLVLEHHNKPEGLNVLYRSYCRGDKKPTTEWQQRGECSGIKDEKVKFEVLLNASKCLKEPETFEFRMQGITEFLKVTVETLCTCDCGAKEENSTHCGGNGTLICGACSCNKGYQGQQCQCKLENTDDMQNLCRKNINNSVCSGHGMCMCGKCHCIRPFNGNYCQCNDASCLRHDNKICNNQGDCECGRCICNKKYTGNACECPTDMSMCSPKQKIWCSGQGTCKCNRCVCNEGFMGEDCSQFANPCKTKLSCMKCNFSKKPSETCSTECESVVLSKLEGQQTFNCSYEAITYNIKLLDNGSISIVYGDLPQTIDRTKVIIGTSVSAIILIGIVIIIIYRILLEVYYQREYHSFLKSQEQNQWGDGNPLYKGATTTVLNPLHTQDG